MIKKSRASGEVFPYIIKSTRLRYSVEGKHWGKTFIPDCQHGIKKKRENLYSHGIRNDQGPERKRLEKSKKNILRTKNVGVFVIVDPEYANLSSLCAYYTCISTAQKPHPIQRGDQSGLVISFQLSTLMLPDWTMEPDEEK